MRCHRSATYRQAVLVLSAAERIKARLFKIPRSRKLALLFFLIAPTACTSISPNPSQSAADGRTGHRAKKQGRRKDPARAAGAITQDRGGQLRAEQHCGDLPREMAGQTRRKIIITQAEDAQMPGLGETAGILAGTTTEPFSSSAQGELPFDVSPRNRAGVDLISSCG